MEYVTLTDFKINEYTNTLDYLTPQGELLIYDSNDKKQFKDSYQIPVMAVHNFLPISPDGYICSNSSTIKPLLFFSKKDNKVEEFNYTLPEHILTTSYGISSVPYYMYGDTIMFRESFSGNIYSLDTTNYTLKERFVWDFMNHQFDLSLIPEGKNAIEIFKLSREISMNYASQFAPPAENDKYIIMPFYYKNNGWVLIYNKEKKEVKAFSKFKEGIQLDRGIISDNALYVLTDPSILNLFTNLSVLDIKNQNIVANINKDEDNLVVLKYTFK